MTRAPDALFKLWADIDRLIPAAQLGGIVGDASHLYGYHLARNVLPGSDYSVQLAADRHGPADCASALDVSLPPHLMKLCTARLVAAAKRRDPRLSAVRELCGTLNGWQTYPWQLRPSNGSEGVDSWDDSHLSHIHVSVLREHCDDYAALRDIALVFAGKGGSIGQKARDVALRATLRKWPYAPGHVLGPRSDSSNRVHGGATPAERARVRWVQTWLVHHGYVHGVKPNTAAARAWVDGVWERDTSTAVLVFKRENFPKLKATGTLGRRGYLLMISGKAKSA